MYSEFKQEKGSDGEECDMMLSASSLHEAFVGMHNGLGVDGHYSEKSWALRFGEEKVDSFSTWWIPRGSIECPELVCVYHPCRNGVVRTRKKVE